MRRTVFILLIVVVIAIVGLYTFLEYRVNDIVYVGEIWELRSHDREYAVRRLYNSNVDVDAFRERVEPLLINAEFTEEEFIEWAQLSGEPALYLAFYYSVYPDSYSNFSASADNSLLSVYGEGDDFYVLSARINQESAIGQTDFNFKITDLYLEVTTDGPQIYLLGEEFHITKGDTEMFPGMPVKSEDGRSMAVELGDILDFSFHVAGTGTVTLKYTYNISTSNIFSRTMLERQLLIVNVFITSTGDGDYRLEYTREPFSSLEEFLG
ncbi:MAG: hypothetical protein LBC86_07145 [Oscillospiraceae bacterium]|jgi:hypothetical protein|nr:hypothetical protein [Oscillospiraceae bacterium]